MENKVLYIVSTYYHALISCLKQIRENRNADIMCTDYIPNGEKLAEKIRESRLFRNTFFVGKIEEYHATGRPDRIFCLHRKNAAMIERQISVKFSAYDEINIFHDDIWAAHYMKDKHIKYRLIEDALDSFKSISRSCFSYMMPKSGLKAAVKRFLGIGYSYFGLDGAAYEIEVNDIHGVEIAGFAAKRLKEEPRKNLFDPLTKADKKLLCNIFMSELPHIYPKRSVLLLTQPLTVDNLVKSEREQIKYYKALVRKYSCGLDVVIKPHPRDTVDYSSDFPNAVILDKNMPVEILSISGIKPFKKTITYNSSCAGWLKSEEIQTAELLFENNDEK